jgi:hypothetical protein
MSILPLEGMLAGHAPSWIAAAYAAVPARRAGSNAR